MRSIASLGRAHPQRCKNARSSGYRGPLRQTSRPPRGGPVTERRTTPEETNALQEKANQQHYRTVARLAALLEAAGWREVQEIPAALDLWAKHPDGRGRVIFEVKSLTDANEVHQCRAALAQLLEYRFFYGSKGDGLCAVLTAPIPDRRRALLEELGVAVMVFGEDGMPASVGRLATAWFGRDLLGTPSSANTGESQGSE